MRLSTLVAAQDIVPTLITETSVVSLIVIRQFGSRVPADRVSLHVLVSHITEKRDFTMAIPIPSNPAAHIVNGPADLCIDS